MGDMNNEMIDIKNFACHANYKDLIKKLTCFKNLENLTSIDKVLTNHPKRFFMTIFSDYCELTLNFQKYFTKGRYLK